MASGATADFTGVCGARAAGCFALQTPATSRAVSMNTMQRELMCVSMVSHLYYE
jgi:hypothetical protein